MPSRNGSRRGFAGMDPARQREIARRGGLARGKNMNGQTNREDNNTSNEMADNQGR